MAGQQDRTLTEAPPAPAGVEGRGPRWCLCLLWAPEEPERVGEVVQLDPGGWVLGRGDGASAGLRRAGLWRLRPGQALPTGPLRSPRVSRDQWVLRASGRGLEVENTGRAALRVDEQPLSQASLQPGQLVEIAGQALFLVQRREALGPEPRPGHPFGEPDAQGIVGEGAAAWALREQLAFLAAREGHVLLRGESGTGKELAARALHEGSRRAAGPWVSRNAATLPEGLVDAELFGNARNYPQAGMAERAGLIGQAHGGTLLLDEFGELSLAVQAHLLRVLDAGEYQRLGEPRARRSDFRLIAATNRPVSALKHDIAARLPLRLELPGLGERPEDLPLLLRALLRRLASRDPALAPRCFSGEAPRVSAAFVAALVRRRWSTHVRELEGIIWASLQRARGELLEPLPEEAPPPAAEPRPAPRDPASLSAEEIQAALDRNEGQQEATWRELGLGSRFVLRRLMLRHGLKARRGAEEQD